MEYELILNDLGRQKLAIFDLNAHVAPKQMVSVTYGGGWLALWSEFKFFLKKLLNIFAF